MNESSNQTFEEEDAMILFEDENSENKLQKLNQLYIDDSSDQKA